MTVKRYGIYAKSRTYPGKMMLVADAATGGKMFKSAHELTQESWLGNLYLYKSPKGSVKGVIPEKGTNWLAKVSR